MNIDKAVKRHNEGEHSDEIAQALREFSQGYPVWREGPPSWSSDGLLVNID